MNKFLILGMFLTFGAHAQISDVSSGNLIQASKVNELIQKINQLSSKVTQLEQKILPVGTIVHSLLTLPQFQLENGDCWKAMEGQALANNDELKALYGYSTIPNANSRFLRNVGTSSVGLGLTQEDDFKSHNHFEKRSTGTGGGGGFIGPSGNWGSNNANNSVSTNNTGGDETRPKNLSVNMFVKFKKVCNF